MLQEEKEIIFKTGLENTEQLVEVLDYRETLVNDEDTMAEQVLKHVEKLIETYTDYDIFLTELLAKLGLHEEYTNWLKEQTHKAGHPDLRLIKKGGE